MNAREQRGLEIAATTKIRQKGPLWLVPSQAGSGTYIVDRDGESPSCTCPDHETRAIKCKHIFAVEYTIKRETNGKGETTVTQTVKVTYRQDWAAYNAAQTHEKERVAGLLRDLCAAIDNPVQKRGRPRLPLSDAVFAAVMKVYGTTSGRRAMTDMREYEAKGLIAKAPHYNSIFNVLEDAAITELLKRMIQESAGPLRAVESDFAVDSSGFSTCTYERWFDAKHGRLVSTNQWVKAHIMVGVKTNVVTSAEITPSYVNDYTQFSGLVNETAAKFDVERISADKAYLGKTNLEAVEATGATSFIPFKSNSTGGSGSPLWKRMFQFFTSNRTEFLRHYHQRSNVETTFHMIKAKFGPAVRSKMAVAQVNEVLCKILCHNLCCLVQASYELGIEPTFWQEAA